MKYIALVLLVVVILSACQSEKVVTQQQPSTPATGTKVFKITGENYKFFMDGKEAPEVSVKQGDKVRIELTSIGGMHDWVVDQFNAKTERVSDGQSTSVEFIAAQKGTFEYYCSVGQHRQMGMVGKLIVE